MKKLFLLLCLGSVLFTGSASSARAHSLRIKSPDHEQTFAYGSERHRVWLKKGNHLALALSFTNDPYVDRLHPREYDDFIFDFPNVVLGKDGRTFYYHPAGGRPVAVAVDQPAFLGREIKLLPANFLEVDEPHGFLTLTLVVLDQGSERASNE